MREICLIFEDDYEDCDIICVSDFIADNATRYGQLFCDFLANTTDESYFVDISGTLSFPAYRFGHLFCIFAEILLTFSVKML